MANPERKIKEGEIEGRKMVKLKRIVKRNMVKARKKDPDGEDVKKMQTEYDYLCALHQKVTLHINWVMSLTFRLSPKLLNNNICSIS